jgi:hypothetical protein
VMNKDAYYFPHDSNAKDDPKCLILIEELGLEGYGIFWVLIETLRDQKDYKASLRVVPALARRYNTSTEKIRAVITRYDLFLIEDDEFFFSPSLINRMKPLLETRHNRKVGGVKGNLIKHKYATKQQLDKLTDEEILRLGAEKMGSSHTDRLAIAVKERKGKNSKVKESKVEYDTMHRPQNLDEVISFFKNQQQDDKMAKDFFYHYDSQSWVKSNGIASGSWQSLAMKWIHQEIHNKPDWKKRKEENTYDNLPFP